MLRLVEKWVVEEVRKMFLTVKRQEEMAIFELF
jgi:hypothetical protein